MKSLLKSLYEPHTVYINPLSARAFFWAFFKKKNIENLTL